VTGTVLVRAPVGVVYRTLTDLDAWPRWLTGCTCARPHARPQGAFGSDGAAGPDASRHADRHTLSLPRPRRVRVDGTWRLEVTVHSWRHDAGVRWDVRGDVELAAEWWLESRPEGTLLHHLVQSVGVREDRVTRHHQVMMQAMQAMKDHLERAVALASGRIP